MSAQEQMRAMLDQLMGTARDGEPGRHDVKFDDPRVCKSFLLGCCPHEILSSTRMDLGDCPKMHNLALKADYEMASRKKDYYYDIDAMEHLQNFIKDCDRRTEMAKRRLKETQEDLNDEQTSKVEKIHTLGEQIGTKLAKAEELGAKGEVDGSMTLMAEVEDLKKQKLDAENEYKNTMPASSYQQQKLRVCEVCSAYLGIHDNDRRLADHFGGKLHLGFITIREKLANLQQKVLERRLERENEYKERKQREESEAKEREERRAREGRHRRSRSRSRGRRSHSRRSRSRSRDRHRRRRRSRSRSRDRRRRSRERRRSRSRSRTKRSRRSRSRSKKSRSRSKSRSRRSGSKETKDNEQSGHDKDSSVPSNGDVTTETTAVTSGASD